MNTNDVNVTVTLVIDENLAFDLAELCKRIGYADCRELSINEEQARNMIRATDLLRDALAHQGVIVR